MLAAFTTAHAQLGGLKKKVADKVAGKKPDTTTTAAATTKPRCDKSSIVITGDVVGRYLKALSARDAEIRKMAGEPGQIGAYYAADFKRKEVTRRKAEFDLRRGADWERYKVLYPKMVHADQAATQQQQALMDTLNPGRIQVPELDWEAQQKGNARLDSVAIQASGISACDFGGTGLGERMPRLVNILVTDPNTRDFQGFATPQEGAAVKARITELAAAMGYVKTQEPTEAEKAHVKEEDDKLVEASMMTGDPSTDCAIKFNNAFMKKHQAEMEKVSKDKDMQGAAKLSRMQAVGLAEACKQKPDNDE
jgi:hypothetical protein